MSESVSPWRRALAPQPTPVGKPLPASGRAGRNLPAAFASAIVLLGVAAVGLFWYRPVLDVFIGLLILAAIWELAGAFARKNVYAQLPPLYLGAAGMITAASLDSVFWLAISLYLTFFAVGVWRFFFAEPLHLVGVPQESTKKANKAVAASATSITATAPPSASVPPETPGFVSKPIHDIIISMFIAVYIPFTAAFVVLLSEAWPDTPWPFAFFIVIVVCSDIGGWFAGITFGKHPLAPRVSPKKTWEGLAGSVILSALAALGATVVLDIAWWWMLPLAMVGSLVGTLGDLIESLIKRLLDLKDMSELVPGHGGLLDRLDALLFTAPMFYIVYTAAL